MAKKPKSNPALHPPRPGACVLVFVYADLRPCFQIPDGYKQCRHPGKWRAQTFKGQRVCPGCDRLCQFPMTPGSPAVAQGEEVTILEVNDTWWAQTFIKRTA